RARRGDITLLSNSVKHIALARIDWPASYAHIKARTARHAGPVAGQ
ncbi:MAG: hypothetical protein ACI8S3_000500, partial [Alphaproteobacteria bacterium]